MSAEAAYPSCNLGPLLAIGDVKEVSEKDLTLDGEFLIDRTHLKSYPVCHHIRKAVDRRSEGYLPDNVSRTRYESVRQ